MKKIGLLVIVATLALSGCALSENACEDITLASEQAQQCQVLQRKITNAKGKPLIRTELERRYQKDCIDMRYYRDDKQPAICANKKAIDGKSK
ncbi:MAG: hypothetical protein COB35_04360 [Gammaproteobacteria bacterium]|nr:MAG: hypothetical protein COB35_04360 [Gammaproteobacteria bacterium]